MGTKPKPVPRSWEILRAKCVLPMPGSPSSSIGGNSTESFESMHSARCLRMSSEHPGEVGQLVEERVHLGKRGGLDGEALAAEAQHLLVHRAQRLVGGGGQLVQRLFDARDVVDVLEARDRNRDVCRHLWPTFLFVAGESSPSENASMMPCT